MDQEEKGQFRKLCNIDQEPFMIFIMDFGGPIVWDKFCRTSKSFKDLVYKYKNLRFGTAMTYKGLKKIDGDSLRLFMSFKFDGYGPTDEKSYSYKKAQYQSFVDAFCVAFHIGDHKLCLTFVDCLSKEKFKNFRSNYLVNKLFGPFKKRFFGRNITLDTVDLVKTKVVGNEYIDCCLENISFWCVRTNNLVYANKLLREVNKVNKSSISRCILNTLNMIIKTNSVDSAKLFLQEWGSTAIKQDGNHTVFYYALERSVIDNYSPGVAEFVLNNLKIEEDLDYIIFNVFESAAKKSGFLGTMKLIWKKIGSKRLFKKSDVVYSALCTSAKNGCYETVEWLVKTIPEEYITKESVNAAKCNANDKGHDNIARVLSSKFENKKEWA
jgi:hypothetical protein